MWIYLSNSLEGNILYYHCVTLKQVTTIHLQTTWLKSGVYFSETYVAFWRTEFSLGVSRPLWEEASFFLVTSSSFFKTLLCNPDLLSCWTGSSTSSTTNPTLPCKKNFALFWNFCFYWVPPLSLSAPWPTTPKKSPRPLLSPIAGTISRSVLPSKMNRPTNTALYDVSNWKEKSGGSVFSYLINSSQTGRFIFGFATFLRFLP